MWRALPRICLALFFLSALLVACGNDPATPVASPTALSPQAAEQAVYTVLFAEIYGEPRMLVLWAETAPGLAGVEGLPDELEVLRSGFSSLQQATLDSFGRRNDTATSLPADMSLGLPYVLMDRVEFDEIFAINTSGWDLFYTRYPNSPGLTTVSRVGFNANLTQAVVYVGTISYWLGGSGVYVLLEFSLGEWQVVEQLMAWIS